MKVPFFIQHIFQEFVFPLGKGILSKYLFCWALLGFLPYVIISIMITAALFSWNGWMSFFSNLLTSFLLCLCTFPFTIALYIFIHKSKSSKPWTKIDTLGLLIAVGLFLWPLLPIVLHLIHGDLNAATLTITTDLVKFGDSIPTQFNPYLLADKFLIVLLIAAFFWVISCPLQALFAFFCTILLFLITNKKLLEQKGKIESKHV